VTSEVYTDHALLTADERITGEVQKLFEFLQNNYKSYPYKHLIVSPFLTRKRTTKLIRREIRRAKAGKEAYIYAKMNSLVDANMIERLYEASRAGVKIRLVIRGICSLVPGVKGLSENIEVISIVDRYLEHSRIFIFGSGGDDECFISSADWMIRNLDHRVEVTVPIYDRALRDELRRYFDIQMRDTVKARVIDKSQDNSIRPNGEGGKHRAQDEIYQWLRQGGGT